ncbi:hypothetical protein PM082_001671 [Marasmius tenuissimus]|nr:hypothetical protein PM082_001671 [Marasmius tenuissimus]
MHYHPLSHFLVFYRLFLYLFFVTTTVYKTNININPWNLFLSFLSIFFSSSGSMLDCAALAHILPPSCSLVPPPDPHFRHISIYYELCQYFLSKTCLTVPTTSFAYDDYWKSWSHSSLPADADNLAFWRLPQTEDNLTARKHTYAHPRFFNMYVLLLTAADYRLYSSRGYDFVSTSSKMSTVVICPTFPS